MNFLYFYKFIIFSLCFIIDIAYCEGFLSPCSINKPFLQFDSTCVSFEDVCIKKGDLSCDNLRNACQQCPSANYSMPMILDVLKMMKREIYENRQNQTAEIQSIKTEIYKSRHNQVAEIQSIKNLNIVLVVLIILFFILMTPMIMIQRITKGIRRMNRRKNTGGSEITTIENQITPLLKSRKLETGHLDESDQSDATEQWRDNLETFAKKMINRLDELKSEITNVNTVCKKIDTMESIESLLNDQFNKIASEIKIIQSKIESTEMKKVSSKIDLKEINENHDLDSLATSELFEANPISETNESQQIGDKLTNVPSDSK